MVATLLAGRKMHPMFFCHIPKTAGTSLRAVLEKLYSPWTIVPDANMIRRQGGEYPEIDLVSLTCHRQRASIRFLRGHYHLSCGQLLGSDVETMVVLRDPVRRTISHLKHMIANFGFSRETLRGYLDRGEIPLPDNVQARFVSGKVDVSSLANIVKRHQHMLQRPILDKDQLHDEAVEALEAVTFLGTVEGLPALVERVVRHVSGPRLRLDYLNVASDVELDLKQRDFDLISEKNDVDSEIYNWALAREMQTNSSVTVS